VIFIEYTGKEVTKSLDLQPIDGHPMRHILILFNLLVLSHLYGQDTIRLLTLQELERQKIYVTVVSGLSDYQDGLTVYRLYLANQGYRKLPPEIFSIKTLQELKLPWNELSGIPPEIEKLDYLQSLNLVWNEFSKFPTGICNLKNLRFLNLPGNGKIEIPACFSELKSLKHLVLTN